MWQKIRRRYWGGDREGAACLFVTAWRLGRRIEDKGEGIIYMLSKDQGCKGGTNRPDGISGRVQVKVERKDVQDTDRAAVVREKKIRNDQHQAGKEKNMTKTEMGNSQFSELGRLY
jgi:hypothetical protein